MGQILLRNCSKLISFKKCGSCDTLSDEEALCKKNITVGTGDGNGRSTSLTLVFHYLEEEKGKTEKSCYWISGLEDLTYFNKSLVDKYHYVVCDLSCKTCEFEVNMCNECSDEYYSLLSETSLKQKHCYHKLNLIYIF